MNSQLQAQMGFLSYLQSRIAAEDGTNRVETDSLRGVLDSKISCGQHCRSFAGIVPAETWSGPDTPC